ncbi:MAG: hypothetical protein K5770_09855 [Lachnospiraceae bacterium]|nr:hypothetical protein [Lachnospiraceae bacterium]
MENDRNWEDTNDHGPAGYEYEEETGLYIKERILPDEEGNRFIYRTCFDPRTGAYSRESFELDVKRQGRSLAAKSDRRKLILIISTAAAVLLAWLLISGLSHLTRIPGDVRNDFQDRVLTRGIPSGSRFASEYEGGIEEGGIIR